MSKADSTQSNTENGVERLDEKRLSQYLQGKIPAFSGTLSAKKFSGGQSNPTFLLQSGEQQFVLRRQPPGKLLKSAHAVDREFKVLAALAQTQVPVAKVYHLCEDRDVLGSMFYVMEYIDGEVYWDSSLPTVGSNDIRSQMYQQMSSVLAALHSVNVEEVGLADFGKPGNYFERQLSRWTQQYHLSEIQPIVEMHELIAWLETHLPMDEGRVSLVHGDYRLDNMIFAKHKPQILAVLDWELSTLGHPLADLAYQCMQLRLPSHIGHSTGLGNSDRQALGIPSEADYVAQYCEKANMGDIHNWQFYLAFSFFRLAAIAQGVAKRAQEGNASSRQASKVGEMVQPLAQMALQLIEKE